LIFHLFDILFDNAASNHLVTFLIVSVVLNLIYFIIIHKIQQVKSEAVIKYSKVVVAVALFGYVICIQGIKYFWGRVRFRELDAAFSQFSPWYLPQGITGYDSFPSGHAAMGWILLPLLILLVNKKYWIRFSMFILIFIWAVVLASSRVVIGAHYTSDVLFGSFFIIITFLLITDNNSK
jgi:membrane-associated phospholipid phosphatase